MSYKKVLKKLLEEFEKVNIKGGRGYSAGSVYSERTPPVYGESEARRKAREDEKKKKRKNKLNKMKDEEVEISKRFKEEDFTLNELKKLIRSILNEEQ